MSSLKKNKPWFKFTNYTETMTIHNDHTTSESGTFDSRLSKEHSHSPNVGYFSWFLVLKGHRDFCNEVLFQSPAEPSVGFKLGTFQF